MAAPKRLVLFVEGQGDRDAVPVLVKHRLTELEAWGHVFLDTQPFVVGEVAKVPCREGQKWVGWLAGARKRGNLAGGLLVLDGDAGRIRGEDFCAARTAARLAELSRRAGGGSLFSVACVFACQEFES